MISSRGRGGRPWPPRLRGNGTCLLASVRFARLQIGRHGRDVCFIGVHGCLGNHEPGVRVLLLTGFRPGSAAAYADLAGRYSSSWVAAMSRHRALMALVPARRLTRTSRDGRFRCLVRGLAGCRAPLRQEFRKKVWQKPGKGTVLAGSRA
jgi:hypothetical protein